MNDELRQVERFICMGCGYLFRHAEESRQLHICRSCYPHKKQTWGIPGHQTRTPSLPLPKKKGKATTKVVPKTEHNTAAIRAYAKKLSPGPRGGFRLRII